MWVESRSKTLAAIEECLPARERADLQREGARARGSAFMALNAQWARHHMETRGSTPEHFAAAAVKARRFGELNPLAQQREAISLDEVLAATPVASPLTRPMCSSFTDGAAAAVLSAGHHRRQPHVVASVLRSGDGTMEYHDRLSETAELAWKVAGISPPDVDLVEIHDATSAEELWALESLGFFEPGEAGPATLAGETSLGGHRVVVNPSGGLVGRGHAFGATGVCQLVELALQLRGSAGARQMDRARVGVAVNTGGIVGGDAGAVAVHVLLST
jgi:acetyl-CoA acetyltransferase